MKQDILNSNSPECTLAKGYLREVLGNNIPMITNPAINGYYAGGFKNGYPNIITEESVKKKAEKVLKITKDVDLEALGVPEEQTKDFAETFAKYIVENKGRETTGVEAINLNPLQNSITTARAYKSLKASLEFLQEITGDDTTNLEKIEFVSNLIELTKSPSTIKKMHNAYVSGTDHYRCFLKDVLLPESIHCDLTINSDSSIHSQRVSEQRQNTSEERLR